jgi:chorismate lyase/3-hydroxybenzoate synthase
LHGDNLTTAVFMKQPTHWKNSVLGVLCFSIETGSSTNTAGGAVLEVGIQVPCLQVPMKSLGAADEMDLDSFCEIWHGNGNLKQGQCGDIYYRHDDDVLFGVIKLPETAFAVEADKTPLQQATESAYQQIFALINMLNYPHLFRCWNYMANINDHSFGLERYRQFNLGRQDAFLAHEREVVGNVPAACALGFKQGPLTIAFLAGQAAPIAIENPRQISAYQYPQQYGPRSPTFARATLVHLKQSEVLFISGTASIVGHATLHATDVVVQTSETMMNIEAVLTEANRVACQSGFSLANLHYRVYVRNLADLKQIQAELTRYIGSPPKAVYLQADVCRQNLLLEIEATAEYPLPSIVGVQNS